LTSGYRTYRLLPVFWREFYPRAGSQTPLAWDVLLKTLAEQRFGARFCPRRQIVQFASPQRLRPEFAEIPEGRLADPNVKLFVARNPGHVDGDELVCIADLSPDNLTPAGKRVVYGASR